MASVTFRYIETADGIKTEPCNQSELIETLGGAGVGKWCAPGPANGQCCQWLLFFDDSLKPPMPFGDDELAARRAFYRAEGNGYNCYLFHTALR